MNKIFIFDIDDTIILHTKERNDYYKMDSGDTLKKMFQKLDYSKIYIYTNGTYGHGYNVINNLDIEDISIIFARDNIPIQPPFQMKPHINSFKYVHETIQNENQIGTNEYYFFDDMKENLRTAKNIGWITILIHPDFVNQKEEYIDYVFPNIYHALLHFS